MPMDLLITRVSIRANFEPTASSIESLLNLRKISALELVPSTVILLTVKTDDQPSKYEDPEIKVIASKRMNKRLSLRILKLSI
jgi:hypothetical protein